MSKSSYWHPCHPSAAELKACSFYEVFHDSSINRGVMAPLFLSLPYLITISSWHLLLSSYKKKSFSLPSETYSYYVLRLALNLKFSCLSIPGNDIIGMLHHTWVIIFPLDLVFIQRISSLGFSNAWIQELGTRSSSALCQHRTLCRCGSLRISLSCSVLGTKEHLPNFILLIFSWFFFSRELSPFLIFLLASSSFPQCFFLANFIFLKQFSLGDQFTLY